MGRGSLSSRSRESSTQILFWLEIKSAMERQVDHLKCSKLNCYAQFNKMVRLLIHCKNPTVHKIVPGAREMHGTHSEYNFYITLIKLLQNVVRNANVDSQKRELHEVYEWFRINKPVLRPKTTTAATQKVKFSFTSRQTDTNSLRPQTAPALLHQQQCDHAAASRPPSSKKNERRPQTTFTSTYMSASLGQKMDLAGRPFDLHEFMHAKRLGSGNRQESDQSVAVSCTPPSKPAPTVSLQSHPSPSFLAGYVPSGHSGLHPCMVSPSIYVKDLISLSPQIGAQIALEKEIPEDYELEYLRKILNKQYLAKESVVCTPPPNTPLRQQTTVRSRSAESLSRPSTRCSTRHSAISQSQSDTAVDTYDGIVMTKVLSDSSLDDTSIEPQSSEESMFLPANPVSSQRVCNAMRRRGELSRPQLPQCNEEEDEPLLPAVYVTRNTTPTMDEGKWCPVVSMSFPEDQELRPKTSHPPRNPARTPGAAAGFKSRYYRPHTVSNFSRTKPSALHW